MLVSRLSVLSLRTLVLALGLAGAAFPQAMIHYGAAATTGAAAGTAAGKKLSDALTAAMNNAAEAAKQGEEKPGEAKAKEAAAQAAKPEPREPSTIEGQKKSAQAGNTLPGTGAPNAAPLPVRSSGRARTGGKSDAAMFATVTRADDELEALSGRPKARRRVAVASIAAAAPESAPQPETAAEMPITMREALNDFHPALAPFEERLQRVEKGTARDEVRRILGAPASRVTIPSDNDVEEIYYYQERGRNVATIRLEAGRVTRVSSEF